MRTFFLNIIDILCDEMTAILPELVVRRPVYQQDELHRIGQYSQSQTPREYYESSIINSAVTYFVPKYFTNDNSSHFFSLPLFFALLLFFSQRKKEKNRKNRKMEEKSWNLVKFPRVKINFLLSFIFFYSNQNIMKKFSIINIKSKEKYFTVKDRRNTWLEKLLNFIQRSQCIFEKIFFIWQKKIFVSKTRKHGKKAENRKAKTKKMQKQKRVKLKKGKSEKNKRSKNRKNKKVKAKRKK